MVLAAEGFLTPPIDGKEHDPRRLTRWALRTLITGHLPESWRYFGVNYYRGIAASIPEQWVQAIVDLESLRPTCNELCSVGPTCTPVASTAMMRLVALPCSFRQELCAAPSRSVRSCDRPLILTLWGSWVRIGSTTSPPGLLESPHHVFPRQRKSQHRVDGVP